MLVKPFTLDETQYKKIVEALLHVEGLDVPGLEAQRLFNAGVNPFRIVLMTNSRIVRFQQV